MRQKQSIIGVRRHPLHSFIALKHFVNSNKNLTRMTRNRHECHEGQVALRHGYENRCHVVRRLRFPWMKPSDVTFVHSPRPITFFFPKERNISDSDGVITVRMFHTKKTQLGARFAKIRNDYKIYRGFRGIAEWVH